MDSKSLGLAVIVFGAVALVVGALIFSGALGWFGKLPGDIRIKSDGTRIYVPITSMILASVVLTVLVNLLRRLF
jgi:NAD/NADP transhydrogenase beta subunit